MTTNGISSSGLAQILESIVASVSPARSQKSTPTPTSPPTTTTDYYPLTTVFKPPQWCSSMRMTFFGDDGGFTSTFWKDSAFGANDSQQVSMRACYPPHFTYQPDLFATDGYIYSPGVCPSGYYAAKSNGAVGKQGGAKTSWCCPHGMTFSAFQGCISLTTPASSTIVYYGGRPLQQMQPYYVLEPYIPVAWATSDLAVFTPTSAPLSVAQPHQCRAASLSRVNGGVSAVAGVPGTSAGKDMANGTSGGLPTAAKAGIGVGVPVTVIAAIVMIVLLLKYRRKAQVSAAELRRRDETDLQELKNDVRVSEADAESKAEADFENARMEADSKSIRPELDSPIVRQEADGSGLKYELDSGWYGHEK